MATSAGISIIKYVFGELLGDFVYAPVWWYTRGFLRLLGKLRDKLKNFIKVLGLKIWIKNLGKPMYGRYDFTSKLISLLMRIVVLFARIFALLFYILWLLIWIMIWILVPILVVWKIVMLFTDLLIG